MITLCLQGRIQEFIYAPPNAMSGIVALSGNKFMSSRKQISGNEFISCSNDVCHMLKRFHRFGKLKCPFSLA